MPESDPGDGEYNDADEFLRDLANVEYDETLIGLVGEGYDVNAPGDQAVADLLGAWRDDVGSAPVGPIAAQEIHELNQQFNGGTTAMSINETAAQLAQMAEDTTAQGMLQTAGEALGHALQMLAGIEDTVGARAAQARELLGGSEGETVAHNGLQVMEETSNVMGNVQLAITKVQELTSLANAFNTVLRDAAQRHLS